MTYFVKAFAFFDIIYSKQFPTSTWLWLKEIALHENLIDKDAPKAK